jgi:hypothetical protein
MIVTTFKIYKKRPIYRENQACSCLEYVRIGQELWIFKDWYIIWFKLNDVKTILFKRK